MKKLCFGLLSCLLLTTCSDDPVALQLRGEIQALMDDYRALPPVGDQDLAFYSNYSRVFLRDQLRAVRTGNDTALVVRAAQDSFPLTAYKQLLFSRYAFFGPLDRRSEKRQLRSYLFFLRLIKVGLLTADDATLAGFRLKRVRRTSAVSALGFFDAYPDNFSLEPRFDFTIRFIQEKGDWKIDLPSSFSYTEAQIEYALRKTGATTLDYQQTQVEELRAVIDSSQMVDPVWLNLTFSDVAN